MSAPCASATKGRETEVMRDEQVDEEVTEVFDHLTRAPEPLLWNTYLGDADRLPCAGEHSGDGNSVCEEVEVEGFEAVGRS